MRAFLPILLVAILAGCATSGAPPTTTTPGTNATPGGGTGGGAATQIKTDTHDFTTDAASGTPAGGSSSTKFTVPSGIASLNVTVKFAPANGAPGAVTNGITVKIGTASCTVAAGPVTAPSTCTKTIPASGVTSIDYSGAGPIVATVTVMGS